MKVDTSRFARQKVLDRIKRAIDAPQSAQWGRDERCRREWEQIPREFRRAGTLSIEECTELLRSRLHDYGAPSRVVAIGEVRTVMAEILREREKKKLVAAPDIPDEWLPAELEIVRDSELSNVRLNEIDGVITGCTVAVAFTGTIILSAHLDGRRALTLLPDYELCVIRQKQIVELIPEAIARLQEVKTTPLTLFSGPSATADIEMIRVQGVHGPRTLDVIIATA